MNQKTAVIIAFSVFIVMLGVGLYMQTNQNTTTPTQNEKVIDQDTTMSVSPRNQ